MPTVPIYYGYTFQGWALSPRVPSNDEYPTPSLSQTSNAQRNYVAVQVLKHGYLKSLFYASGGMAIQATTAPPSTLGVCLSTLSVPDVEDVQVSLEWNSIVQVSVYAWRRRWTSRTSASIPDAVMWLTELAGHLFQLAYYGMPDSGGYQLTLAAPSNQVEVRFGDTVFQSSAQVPPTFSSNQYSPYFYQPGQVNIEFSDIEADAIDQSPGAATYRIVNSYGLRSSWASFQLAPRAYAVPTNTEDGFEADAFKSVDFDHGIAKIEWFYRGTYNNKNINVSIAASEVRRKVFAFNWEDLQAFDPSTVWADEALILFTEVVTDKAGYTDSFNFSVPYKPQTDRARFIVRPTGVIKQRDKSILWQHKGLARIWAGEPKTGNVLASDDEGDTWTQMAQPWASVSGAKIRDFENLPHGGACSIAQVSGRIVFRRSFDGVTWDDPVDVCDAGKAASWCVRVHLAAGLTTLSIRDMVSAQFDSDALGEADSWRAI